MTVKQMGQILDVFCLGPSEEVSEGVVFSGCLRCVVRQMVSYYAAHEHLEVLVRRRAQLKNVCH